MSAAIKRRKHQHWSRERREQKSYAAYRKACECCHVWICYSVRQHLEMKHNCKECSRYVNGECPYEEEVTEIIGTSIRGVPSSS